MKKLGLIGQNIQHSLSAKLHHEIGKIFNLSIDYQLIDVDVKEISSLMKALRNKEYDGFNVTMPFKVVVMDYLDVISERAKRIGAVNTIYLKDNLIYGDNTDYDGFLAMIKQSKLNLENQEVYILGSGGAAKAAYVVLTDLKAKPIIVKRETSTISKMFKEVITYNQVSSTVNYIVNATPIGMYPNIEEPLLTKEYLENKTVFDLIYSPRETKLMSYAKVAYNGLLMLYVQAVAAESLFWQIDLKFDNEYIMQLNKELKNE